MRKFGPFLMALIVFFTLLACSEQPNKSQLKIIDESFVDLDLLAGGSLSFEEFEYQEEAYTDPEISPLLTGDGTLPIDIRGRLFLPQTLQAAPLIVFLHGNHSTCGRKIGSPADPRLDYEDELTFTGQCPAGAIEAPSYRGYDEAARHLASHGFAVISINANRGINGNVGRGGRDDYLVYVRGLLVLKHLEALQRWSSFAQVPSVTSPLDLRGRLDWSEVGLMGHSRGGEGMRFAYDILNASSESATWKARLPDLKIQSIFEVGPVDRGIFTEQRIKRVSPQGADWAVLIPGCDADVSDFEGLSPYLRMLKESDGRSKAVFTVWGANHNFFNSEWHISDAPHSCQGGQVPLWDTSGVELVGGDPNARIGLKGSPVQRDMMRALLLSFFKAHLGKQRWSPGAAVFDPQYRLPRQLTQLAPTQREFVRTGASQLVFRGGQTPTGTPEPSSIVPEDLLAFLAKIAARLAKEKIGADERGFEIIVPHFHEGDILRPSWVFYVPEGSKASSAYLPFGPQLAAKDYWTLDLTAAMSATCPDRACQIQEKPISVSLVYSDGSTSAALPLSQYAELQPLKAPLLNEKNEFSDATGEELHINFLSATPLFQTIRIELKDFAESRPLPIAGLRLAIPAGSDSALIVESVRLSQRP